jgi:metacaspase-1
MATGMSIHVGVNDTKAAGVSAPLKGCDQDAKDMFALARNRGFIGVNDGEPDEALLGDQATHDAVLGKMRIAAEELEPGDIFLFTFSGHGTRRGQEDLEEKDLKDETLVMQDKFLVDNVLRRLIWPQFKAGVRVVMVSDSCHSGGAAMSLMVDSESESESSNGGSSVATTRNGRDWSPAVGSQTRNVRSRAQGEFRIRTISESEAQTHFELLKEFYDQLRDTLPKDPPPVQADFLLLAACRETEPTKDGIPNGLFTGELLKVFNSNDSKTYKQIMGEISANLRAANEESHPVIMSIPDLSAFSETEAFRI